jgi:hypothetical protein
MANAFPIWTKAMWTTLHFVSFAYPANPSVSDKQHYKSFYESIPHVIPCHAKCGPDFAQHMKKHNLDKALESRGALIQWVVDMHNEVNIATGKPTWTVAQVMDHYSKLAKGEDDNSFMYAMVGGGALGALMYYMMKKSE